MPQFGLPSSLLAKGLPTMADADRLGKIASIGQDLITTQLTDGGVVAVVETRFPKPKQLS